MNHETKPSFEHSCTFCSAASRQLQFQSQSG
jgi:hypothetical protein